MAGAEGFEECGCRSSSPLLQERLSGPVRKGDLPGVDVDEPELADGAGSNVASLARKVPAEPFL